jgi:hypothetical protein
MNDSHNCEQPSPLARQSCNKQPLFPLGRLLATPGALRTLEEFGVTPTSLVFERHVVGDWGDLCDEDRHANDMALLHGTRILSAYSLKRQNGSLVVTEKLWVITEADRHATTILRPDEY